MEKISHLTLSCLLIFLSNIACASFVLSNKPFTAVKRAWILSCLSVGSWAMAIFNAGLAPHFEQALFWFRVGNLAALFIPILFFHFVLLLTEQQNRNQKQLKLYYAITITYFSISLFFPDLFVDTAKPKDFTPYYAHSGAIYPFFFFMYIYIFSLGLSILFRSYKTASAPKKNQYKFVFVGIFVGAVSGGSTFLPIFDIDINPLLNYLTPIYIIAISYAIVKHQLMDIRIVVRKSAVYTFLAASISLLYLLIVLGLEKLFQIWFGYKSPKISIATAFVIGLFAVPLRQRIQTFVDRHFFKGTQEEIALQNELLRREVGQAERHKAVAALAGGIAHEIRNPLTALKAFYEYFPQKKDDPEFLAKFTRITDKEIGRIEGLIQQLLDFAKPSPPLLRDMDIHQLIEDTLDLLANKLKTYNIQLDQHLSPVTLKIDPNQIKQALLNILLNAIEAMPGGGELTIESRIKGLQVFEISIQDTGCGIAAKDLPHIFEPFFSKKETGTGLGLAITKTIVEEHKGRIKVKSEPGKGTEFTIELPMTQ